MMLCFNWNAFKKYYFAVFTLECIYIYTNVV